MKKVICSIVVFGFVINVFSQEGTLSKGEKQKSSFFNETGIIPFPYRSVRKGKRNFRDSLYYLIERKMTKPPAGYMQSDIVYIDYDKDEKKLWVPNTTNSICKGYVEKFLQDKDVVKLIGDSAVKGFILPVFFMIYNDDKPFGMDELLISNYAVSKLLEMLAKEKNNNREIWHFVPLVDSNWKRTIDE